MLVDCGFTVGFGRVLVFRVGFRVGFGLAAKNSGPTCATLRKNQPLSRPLGHFALLPPSPPCAKRNIARAELLQSNAE